MNIDPDRELKGWELKGALLYSKGLFFLLVANVLFLADTPSTEVWLWLNGIGAAMVWIGTYLLRGQRDQDGRSDHLKRLSKK